MISFFMNNLLWTAGWPVLVVIVVFLLVGFMFSRVVLVGGLLMLVFSLYFFRNPDRVCNADGLTNAIICPADGTIIDITDDPEFTEGYAQKIAIFLSVFDVHVQWAPVAGVVKDVVYTPGAFFKAYLPKSSKENEHNDIVIETMHGTILMRQIAGIIARRICCWVQPEQEIAVCDKIGMIRFGSRVELLLPQGVTIDVQLGEQVYGGQTVLGRFA